MYSENPVLSDDVMLYKDNPLQKLGMYKWQVGLQILALDTVIYCSFEISLFLYKQILKTYSQIKN